MEYHPRRKRADKTIPLDVPLPPRTAHPDSHRKFILEELHRRTGLRRPWAPFWTWADFETVEICITELMKDRSINRFLQGVTRRPTVQDVPDEHSKNYQRPYRWFEGTSNVTLQNARQVHATLAKARHHVHEVCLIISCLPPQHLPLSVPVEELFL